MMRTGGLPATVDPRNHCIAILALGDEKQCLFLIGSRRKPTNVRRRPRSPASPGNVCAEILTISASTMRSWGTITAYPPISEGDGASAFAADPEGSFHEQTVFWAP